MDDKLNNQTKKRPRIPDQVQKELWARAAGRCEFKGCNELVYKDELTQKKDNLATISHIIAFSPDGPRGHETESKRLETDISNLMLTCRDHGKIIDSHAYVKDYPVDVLRGYKRDHENRIRVLTAIQEANRTHILIMQIPIAGKSFTIDVAQVHHAILPRYPADEHGLVINLSDNAIPEDASHFWIFMADTVTARFNELLAEGIKKGRIKHISVFSLAPIPLLMHLGTLIGNKVPADFYQFHRQSQSWIWEAEDGEVDGFFTVIAPEPSKSTRDVALVLSISGKVDQEKVQAAMNKDFVTYKIVAADPGFDFLKSKERLWRFGSIFRNVLAEIRTEYGHDSTIHVFPAVPAPIAIECGKSLMKKCDPSVQVYDLLRREGFKSALELQASSCKVL